MIAPSHPQRGNGQRPTRQQAWDVANRHLDSDRITEETSPGIGRRMTETVGRYPVVAIAAAAVIGITAGWLVKRKF